MTLNQSNYARRALVVTLSDASTDPRPSRNILILKDQGYEVDVLCLPITQSLTVRRLFVIRGLAKVYFLQRVIRKLNQIIILITCSLGISLTYSFVKYLHIDNYTNINELLGNGYYQLVFIEDLILLPFIISLVNENCKVLFDAREFYPRQYEQSLRFRLLEQPLLYQLCHRYLKQCDAVITVSNGLAKEYKRVFGIDTQVIRSVPNMSNCQVKPVLSERIKMVHHGGANRNRKIENMIYLFDYLDDRFTLDFYLVGNDPYIAELQELAKKHSRIKFCEPVKLSEIVPMLNNYDIGIFLVEPQTFNLKHCLPNKLFEFIQGRLMVGIGPSPDMAEIVNQYQCGVVAEGFQPQTMAKCLNSLTGEQIYQYKLNSELAAQELNWEKESIKLQTIIENLVNDHG